MAKVYSKIWDLGSPINREIYADASPESVNTGPNVDSELSPEEFVFKWEPGSDLVGDCIWPWMPGQITIRKELASELVSKFAGMKMFLTTALGAPRKKGARKRPIDPIEFAVLWPTHWLSYDEELSTVEEKIRFANIKLPTIIGAETYEQDYRPLEGINKHEHVPRLPDKGLFVHREDLAGFEIFRPRQLGGMMLCTDKFRQFFVERNVSNILFLEVGDVID
jgi:hypothetical protein